MKQFLFILISLLSFTSLSFAQTTGTALLAKAGDTDLAITDGVVSNANIATNTATVETQAPKLSLKYKAVYSGPNFTADGNDMHGADTALSNRFKIGAAFANKMDAGIEARLETSFTKNGMTAKSGTTRIYGNMPAVYSQGIMSVDVLPRLMLPTTISSHNKSMTISPELIVSLNVNPTNSRFSFSYAPQALKYFYSNDAIATQANAASFIFVHNFDFAYQLNPSLAMTLGIYPEYTITKQLPFTNTSNEIDLGVSVGLSKNWSLNPYIGFEPVGADSSNIGKSMQLALTLSGTLL